MKVLAFLLMIAALLAIYVAFVGWAMMLALGVVHTQVLPAVHAAGFGTSAVLGVLVAALCGGSGFASSSKS